MSDDSYKNPPSSEFPRLSWGAKTELHILPSRWKRWKCLRVVLCRVGGAKVCWEEIFSLAYSGKFEEVIKTLEANRKQCKLFKCLFLPR